MILFEPTTDYDQMAFFDRICFPQDEPADYASANWLVGRDGDQLIAFCAWKKLMPGYGFLYRAGVLPQMTGLKLQRRMIRLREEEMLKNDLLVSLTYTDADAVASMKNLIAEGYRPYKPTTDEFRLSGAADRIGRVGFVHWHRKLI